MTRARAKARKGKGKSKGKGKAKSKGNGKGKAQEGGGVPPPFPKRAMGPLESAIGAPKRGSNRPASNRAIPHAQRLKSLVSPTR